MNLEEVKKYLEENKESEEVKSYLDSFKVNPTLEVFKEKLLTDSDYRSFMDSEKDKHLSKGLETFKTNNLETLVSERVKELYPQEDEKDLAMNQLRKEMEQMKSETQREKLMNLALKTASEKKLPTEIVNYFLGADEETTLKNLESFEGVFNSTLESKLKAQLQGQGDSIPNQPSNLESSFGKRLAQQNVESNKVSEDKQDHYFK